MSDTPSSPSPESRSDQPPISTPPEQASVTAALENQTASYPDATQASDPSATTAKVSLSGDSSPANESSQRVDPHAPDMKALDVATPLTTREQVTQNADKAEAQAKHDESREKATQESDRRVAGERSSEDARAEKLTNSRDAGGDKKSGHEDTKSSTFEKLTQGTDKVLHAAKTFAEAAKTFAGAAKTGALEQASNKIGSAARAIESGSLHAPDAIVKTTNKVVDSAQGALFKIAASETGQKISGFADKVADGVKSHEKGIVAVSAAANYLEAREAGLGRPAAATEAGFRAVGDLATLEIKGAAGAALSHLFEAGGRGLGIAVETASDLAKGDQRGLNRIMDGAMGGKLGRAASVGDWIGDHAWSLSHR